MVKEKNRFVTVDQVAVAFKMSERQVQRLVIEYKMPRISRGECDPAGHGRQRESHNRWHRHRQQADGQRVDRQVRWERLAGRRRSKFTHRRFPVHRQCIVLSGAMRQSAQHDEALSN